MGDCTDRSKRTAAAASDEEQEEASRTSLLSKKAKLKELKDDLQQHLPSTNAQLLLSPEKTTSSSDFFSSCRSSSNDSLEIVKDSLRFTNLEDSSFENEASTCNDNSNNKKFREASPLSEICANSVETAMDSPPEKPPQPRGRNSPAVAGAEMPSLAEIDAFFRVAEKHEQKRFTEKYNYDIVKDVPLEGRYQWIPLKPRNEKWKRGRETMPKLPKVV